MNFFISSTCSKIKYEPGKSTNSVQYANTIGLPPTFLVPEEDNILNL